MFRELRLFSSLVVLCGWFQLGIAYTQEPKLAQLLSTSPAPANAAVYIHAPSLRKLISDAKMSGGLSAELEELWFISDLDTNLQKPNWEAGFAITTRNQDAESLKTAVGGYVDTIASKQVVWSPKQAYLLPIGVRQIGILRPANRKLASGWLTSTKQSPVSEYLRSQAKQPEAFLSLMIAIDLKHAFSPVPLASRISNFESLAGRDIKTIASILASVNGLSIIVGRQSLSECIFSIEFSQSPESLLPIAAALVNEVLNRNGSAVPEVLSWKASVNGDTLSLRGAIAEDTLEGLLGIFSLKHESEQLARAETRVATSPSPGAVAPTSKKYFDQVVALIEKVRKYSAHNTGYRAKWNDQQARRIDELPTLSVDPQMIDYGANVSSLLRNNALTIRSGNIQTGAIDANLSLYSGGYYGSVSNGYASGYYDPNSSTDYQRVADAQARASGYGNYQQSLSMIDKLTADIRRAMTAKYSIQF